MRSTDQTARLSCHKHGGNPCVTKNHKFPTHTRHAKQTTTQSQTHTRHSMLKLLHFHHFIHKTKLKNSCGLHNKMSARYEPQRMLCTPPPPVTRVLAKGPVTSAFHQDDVAPITPPWGGAEITQDSPCDVASCGQVLAYINFPIHRIHRSFVRHKVRPYSLYARMRFCELTERITHGLLVDTFSSKGKHICALSKHHAVKMAYMDKWRSAPSILVPNAA